MLNLLSKPRPPTSISTAMVAAAMSTHCLLWTSSDGITWSRVPDDEAAFGGEGNQWMANVTTGGPGLVAVGSDTSALTCTTIPTAFLCDADSDAAVWKD